MTMAASGLVRQDAFDVRWLRNTAYSRAAASTLAGGAFDLVHVDTIGLLPALDTASEVVPIALNHHNIESQMLERRAEREAGAARRWYLRREAGKFERLERARCPGVGINLVVSELDGERLRALAPGSRTAIVENGVDPEYFRRSDSEIGPSNRLVFSGTMGWYPNHDAMEYFLREIWPRLTTEDREFQLTIIGKQPRPELQRMVQADTRVELTGTVDDVRPWLHRAGIYVCPMRDGGGTRLKVLDALASGLPLVASTMSVEGLALEPNRHYLAADTPADFAAAVLRLRHDPALRSRLAREGPLVVRGRYAWEAIGARLEAAYGAAIAASVPITPRRTSISR
jgi:glycosyltransferase involved in cell wall biosynthesis